MPAPPGRLGSPFISWALLVLATMKGVAAQEARVIADEIVTTTTLAKNGSSPMWCVGAPLLVRQNGNVWASISVHDTDAVPYCNTHWELWRRPADGVWSRIQTGPAASEREPCPLLLLNPGSLVLSVHPKILDRGGEPSGEIRWHCQPALAAFDLKRSAQPARLWRPAFDASAQFTQHSYRGVGVDSANGSMMMMVIDHADAYHAAWRDSAGSWHAMSPPRFPVRACYPNIAFHSRAAHVLAIGDIREPNEVWKAEKFRVLGRDWDYVFRRLFYTWTPDVASADFTEPTEIDTVDDTAGWMFNLDLLVDARDRVHLLWVRRTFDHGFLGRRFFPGRPNLEVVTHAIVERGRVVAREQLSRREIPTEIGTERQFTSGRLHELPDGRLVAILIAPTPAGDPGMYLQALDPNAQRSIPPVRVPLAQPPPEGFFFTNTTRGGSSPAHDLDVLCAETRGDVVSLRYIHVSIR